MRYQTILKVFLPLLTMLFLAEGGESLNWTSSDIITDENLLNDSVRNSAIADSKPIKKILNLSSVWGCDKYSTAVEVLTKRAIALAEEIRIYLQSSQEKTDNKFSQQVSIRNKKTNLLNRGVDFYRDFYQILKIIWLDTVKAFTVIGEMISDELEFRISGSAISTE